MITLLLVRHAPSEVSCLQVGFVTVICATCFTLRALIVGWSALDKQNADLDVWQHPLLDIIYYTLVEIVPSALVLFILRCVPAHRPRLPRLCSNPHLSCVSLAAVRSIAVLYEAVHLQPRPDTGFVPPRKSCDCCLSADSHSDIKTWTGQGASM